MLTQLELVDGSCVWKDAQLEEDEYTYIDEA